MVRKGAHRGFTLIELMVALAVLAIMMTVAVPNFRDFVLRNRVASSVNELVAHVMLARTEAVKRGRRVTLCPSNDQTTCLSTFANWGGGWITFVDLDGDRTLESGDTVLRVYRGNAAVRIAWNNANGLQFSSRGLSNINNGTFTFCPDNNRSEFARQVIVSLSGRPRTVSGGITCS